MHAAISTNLATVVVNVWVLRVLHDCLIEVGKRFFLLTKLHLQASTFDECIRPDLHKNGKLSVQQESNLLYILANFLHKRQWENSVEHSTVSTRTAIHAAQYFYESIFNLTQWFWFSWSTIILIHPHFLDENLWKHPRRPLIPNEWALLSLCWLSLT